MTSHDTPGEEGHRVIHQFMWAYQPHFRIGIEGSLRRALEAIGFMAKPEVMLIGFQVAGEHGYPVCIEPEDGQYVPADLADVPRRGEELYEQRPDRNMFDTDPSVHESRQRGLRDTMRAKAIREALAATGSGKDRTFLVGNSTRVDDYEVHVVVSLERDALAQVPRLQTTERNRFAVIPSLAEAVVRNVLYRAGRGLHMPNPGSSFDELGADAAEIARTAAANFVRTTLYCASHLFGDQASELFNAISALPYEGRSGSGKLIFAKAEHPAIDVVMKFRHPVDIDDAHSVRKLLEASGIHGDLLSDGEDIYGFGHVNATYDPSSETVFEVNMAGRGVWELSHAAQALLSVRDGIPRLPSRQLDYEYFRDIVERLLPGANEPALLRLAEAAGDNEHGAMLIVSSNAAAEAERLAPQAWSVEPARLAPELLSQLTSMDGGVLVDPDGYCHAIGVILDGSACGNESPARGSRFNNAVRYLDSNPPQAVVIVYSTDGNIDILPQLRRRVSRGAADDAVLTYVANATSRPPGRLLPEARRTVNGYRFYLSQEQCDQVNAAKAAEDSWNKKHSHWILIQEELAPDPLMNESYWLSD